MHRVPYTLILARGFRILFLWESAQKVIGYIRVSTDEQGHRRDQPGGPKGPHHPYCQQFGLNLLDIYQDSGPEGTRATGLQAALATMIQRDALLMSVSLCRISRSVGDWHYLLDTYFGRTRGTSSSRSMSQGRCQDRSRGNPHLLSSRDGAREKCRRPVNGHCMRCALKAKESLAEHSMERNTPIE